MYKMSFVILLPFHKMIWDKANVCGDGRDFVRHINLVGYAVLVADNCAVTVAGQQLPYCQLAGICRSAFRVRLSLTRPALGLQNLDHAHARQRVSPYWTTWHHAAV